MPKWFQKIIELLFTKKKILAWIAAVIIAVLAAVFGLSPQEIRDAVKDAPVLELPTVTTVAPSGK